MEVCERFGHVLFFCQWIIIAFRRIQHERIKTFETRIQCEGCLSGLSFVDIDNEMFSPLITSSLVQCIFSMALHR